MWFSEYPINFIKIKCAVATDHKKKIRQHTNADLSQLLTGPIGPDVPNYPVKEEVNCPPSGCTVNDL